MKRFLAPLALALIAGTTAHAQTTTRSYNSSAGWGTTGTSVVGTIAGQTVSGGFPNYAGTTTTTQVPTYGYTYAPTYNYNDYSNYNSYNYPNTGNYAGYGGYAGYPSSYYIPGQTTYLPSYGGAIPPSITTLPQVVTNGVPVPVLPYGYGGYGYGYPVTGSTFSATATLPNGTLSYNSVTVDPQFPAQQYVPRNAFGRPLPRFRTR